MRREMNADRKRMKEVMINGERKRQSELAMLGSLR